MNYLWGAEADKKMSKPPAAQELQHKNWCFTYHFGGVYDDDRTPRPTREQALQKLEELSGSAEYLLAGFEKAPTTGQDHVQGYVQLTSRARRSQLSKIVPRCHFEPARGDDQANYDYCTKSKDFVEWGERKSINGGVREQERWARARAAATAGNLEAIPDQIFVAHYSSVRAIAKDYMVTPDSLDAPTGVWIHGEAGVGKSFRARQDYPEAYLKLANKWWDGYQGQKFVILDDFDKGHSVLGHHLKIWGDRYPFIGEIKGGALAIRPEKIVITSQYAIEDIWQDEETIAAIRRRYKVLHLAEPFKHLKGGSTKNGVTFNHPEATNVVDLTQDHTPPASTKPCGNNLPPTWALPSASTLFPSSRVSEEIVISRRSVPALQREERVQSRISSEPPKLGDVTNRPTVETPIASVPLKKQSAFLAPRMVHPDTPTLPRMTKHHRRLEQEFTESQPQTQESSEEDEDQVDENQVLDETARGFLPNNPQF